MSGGWRRIVFAAGGTGGHVRPALAVLDALERAAAGGGGRSPGPQHSFRWLCSGRRDAERSLPAGRVEATALFPDHRQGAPPRSRPWSWLAAVRRASRALRDSAPALLVGFGGYVTAVAAAAALVRPGVRTILSEQNACAGRSLRLAARRALHVFCPFEETLDTLPGGVSATVTGTPIDPCFARLAPPSGRHVLVLGGSQGALALDRMALEAAERVAACAEDVTWTIVTGRVHLEPMRERLAERPALARRVELVGFAERPERLVERASLVVSRAGGATIAELLAAGRPALLVPFPFARDDHQRRNAEAVERRGGGWLFEQESGPEALAERVLALLEDREALAATRRSALAAARPAAAEEIAARLLAWCGGEG